jgi:hypothetical protein
LLFLTISFIESFFFNLDVLGGEPTRYGTSIMCFYLDVLRAATYYIWNFHILVHISFLTQSPGVI